MRFYQRTNSNPDGVPEDTTRCIAVIYRDNVQFQCSRKRGHGRGNMFCVQHSTGRPIVPIDYAETEMSTSNSKEIVRV